MGNSQAKEKGNNPRKKNVEANLRAKVKLQREEMREIMSMRENESQVYEEEMMVFALKETEWKRERKRLREEVKKLRETLEDKEERIRGGLMEDHEKVGEKSENEWKMLGNSYLMERMREERARRDEAVEKWKKLYLAIKAELDHLIKMTHQGGGVSRISAEEDLTDELRRELKAKEERIEVLLAQLASMEKERSRMEREVDILRQSLRIMSHKKAAKSFKKSVAKKT